MSYFEDWYEGPDPFDFEDEWEYCEKCESSYPPEQEFCHVCLSDESKWKLGIL